MKNAFSIKNPERLGNQNLQTAVQVTQSECRREQYQHPLLPGTRGSYINFLQSNIVPIGGLTSAEDKNPLSMVLQNVPDQVNAGTSLEEAVAGITAIVSFEEG